MARIGTMRRFVKLSQTFHRHTMGGTRKLTTRKPYFVLRANVSNRGRVY
jgi:hypothetical protein